jgi:hypothetical protein
MVMQRHPMMQHFLDASWWTKLDQAIAAQVVLDAAGMPLIGDNDDGMAVKVDGSFPGTPSTEHMYQAYVGACGRTRPEPPTIPSHSAFESFGLDVWFRERYTLTARCGSLGQYGKGGHAHNDHNSITLDVDGKPVIIDPGSYVYTADPVRRNKDRSTQSHSTVVSEIEQREWPDGLDGLFWLLGTKPDPKVIERGSGTWLGEVVHQNKRGYTHRRHLTLHQDGVHISDRFGDGSLVANMVLVLHPDVEVSIVDQGASLSGDSFQVVIQTPGSHPQVEPWMYAPSYQVQKETRRLVVPLQHGRLDWWITLP